MSKTIEFKTKDYLSGLFLIVAIITITITFLYVRYINSNKKYIHYYTYFNSTYGITKNAQIYYLEMPIGYVSNVSIVDLNRIKMDILIERKYKNLIKKDSKISILSSLGLNTILNGKGLQIINGKESKLLKPNSKIESIPPESIDSMIKKFEIDKLAKKIKHIIINIDKLTTQLTDSKGDFQQTISNINRFSNKLATKPLLKIALKRDDYKNFSSMVKNLDISIKNANNAIIEANNFLKNKDINSSLKNLKKIFKMTKKIVKDIKFLSSTLRDNIHLKNDIEDVEDSIEQSNKIIHKINSIKIFQDKSIDKEDLNIQ